MRARPHNDVRQSRLNSELFYITFTLTGLILSGISWVEFIISFNFINRCDGNNFKRDISCCVPLGYLGLWGKQLIIGTSPPYEKLVLISFNSLQQFVFMCCEILTITNIVISHTNLSFWRLSESLCGLLAALFSHGAVHITSAFFSLLFSLWHTAASTCTYPRLSLHTHTQKKDKEKRQWKRNKPHWSSFEPSMPLKSYVYFTTLNTLIHTYFLFSADCCDIFLSCKPNNQRWRLIFNFHSIWVSLDLLVFNFTLALVVKKALSYRCFIQLIDIRRTRSKAKPNSTQKNWTEKWII